MITAALSLAAISSLAPSSQVSGASPSKPFSAWDCPLSQLEERSASLAANKAIMAKGIAEELIKQAEKDPDFSSLTSLDAQKPEFAHMVGLRNPYDFNRLISPENPQIYLNASMVKTPTQDFILAACPRVLEQATELFMNILNGKASKRVWASVLDSSEEPSLCNNFWNPDFVNTLPLRDGWKLITNCTAELAEGTGLSAKGTKTTLVKTTLVFSNGIKKIEVNHLQYKGWFNKSECPDEGLFMRLLEEMDTLNTQEDKAIPSEEVPIIINCAEGVGRTGMTATGYICYKKIKTCPKEKLATKTLNIPRTIFALRKQRTNMVSNYKHIITLHSYFGHYSAKRLQKASTQ